MRSPVYHSALFSMKMMNKCLITGKIMNIAQNSAMVVFIPTGTSIHEMKVHCKTSIIQEDVRHS